MHAHILTASLLLVVPIAAGCARAHAAIPDTAASPAARVGVAGNCPAGTGPMQPAPAGAVQDRNGDGYVCARHFPSIAGDTLHDTVDDDSASADSTRAEPDPYRLL